jgi:hypothetical protein
MKNISLSLPIGLIFLSVNIVMAIAQSTKQEKAPSEQMKKEVDQLASRFIDSLQATGDLRKVDPKLLHPMFYDTPCELLDMEKTYASNSARKIAESLHWQNQMQHGYILTTWLRSRPYLNLMQTKLKGTSTLTLSLWFHPNCVSCFQR